MPDTAQLGPNDNSQVDKQDLAVYEKMKKDLRDMISKKKAIDKNLASLEEQIYKYEEAYLEDTPNGNIIKGFDNYLKTASTIGSGSSSSFRKKTTYTENDRLFSLSSATYLKTVHKELFESLEENGAPSGNDSATNNSNSTGQSIDTNGTNGNSNGSVVHKSSLSQKKKKRRKGADDSSSSESEEEHLQNKNSLPKRLKLQVKDDD
ncbi:histone acetyltransferase subunit NuA4-domain-containing protein [Dipodascopsis uninucleata]